MLSLPHERVTDIRFAEFRDPLLSTDPAWNLAIASRSRLASVGGIAATFHLSIRRIASILRDEDGDTFPAGPNRRK